MDVVAEKKPTVDWFALIGVLVTVVLHLILQFRKPNPIFITGACLFWAGFIVYRGIRDPGIFRCWGFRSDNLRQAAVIPFVLLLTGVLVLGAFALWNGQFLLSPWTALLFVLYPVWGLFQQFLTLGIVVQSLERLPAWQNRPFLLTITGSVVFGAIHFPDLWAVAATFVLELVLAPVFLRYRNLWPLGLVHGWLGILFYTWGMGHDVIAENFGQ